MLSGDAPHLQLIHSAPGAVRRAGAYGSLTLPATPELERFLRLSAERGLDSTDALRLAIERELALVDADALGLDRYATRHVLRQLAARARVRRGLDADEAAYLRALSAARALPPPRLAGPLTVMLPRALLGRARGVISTAALAQDAIPEMVAWEIAARVQGRAMGEWALLALAAHGRAVAL
jgi:hypothetical protein